MYIRTNYSLDTGSFFGNYALGWSNGVYTRADLSSTLGGFSNRRLQLRSINKARGLMREVTPDARAKLLKKKIVLAKLIALSASAASICLLMFVLIYSQGNKCFGVISQLEFNNIFVFAAMFSATGVIFGLMDTDEMVSKVVEQGYLHEYYDTKLILNFIPLSARNSAFDVPLFTPPILSSVALSLLLYLFYVAYRC
jgi:hypothetical protein